MNLLLGLPLGIFRMLGVVLMTVLRFAPVIIVLVIGVLLYRKHRKMTGASKEEAETPPKTKAKHGAPQFNGPVVTVDYREVKEEDVCAEPDTPAAFGHKPGWIAVRSRDPRAVMDALQLIDRRPTNWTCGLSAVGAGKWFVSPALDGWVLVVGAGEKPLSQARVDALCCRFSETQIYVSDRERSTYSWSRYRDGVCIRAYGMSRGEVFLDQGELTMEEISLGFGRFPRKVGGGREGFPDCDAVLAIAAAWGIDPMLEQRHDPPSAGWLCTAE